MLSTEATLRDFDSPEESDMGRKNPFVRMNWLQRAPRLVKDDVIELQTALRNLFPEMVLFPRSYHFHELGDEVKRPQFIEDMARHFEPHIVPLTMAVGESGGALAVRVPWPDEISSGNLQRLLGRPHRLPYDDSPQAFRRFGRTAYFNSRSEMCYSGVAVELSATLVPHHGDTRARPIRVLLEYDGFEVEIPHDADDREVVAFAKSVMSIVNRLGTNAHCYYDCVTGAPLFVLRGQPSSKSFMMRCAMEPGLYLYLVNGTVGGHPIGVGPTPAQVRKWRREAGLSDDSKLQNPPAMSWPEYSAWHQHHVVKFSEDMLQEISRLKSEAFAQYISNRTKLGPTRHAE